MKQWLRLHGLAIAIVILTGALEYSGVKTHDLLRWDRQAITHGEYWRLLTGHFVHLNASHWLLNMMGWVLSWALYVKLMTLRRWLILISAASIAISLGMFVLNTDLGYYVGFSGTLHAVFIAGALLEIRYGWRWGGSVLLIALIVKLFYEQLFGSLPGTTEMAGGPVMIDAHLYGAVAGLVIVLPWIWRPTQSQQRSSA